MRSLKVAITSLGFLALIGTAQEPNAQDAASTEFGPLRSVLEAYDEGEALSDKESLGQIAASGGAFTGGLVIMGYSFHRIIRGNSARAEIRVRRGKKGKADKLVGDRKLIRWNNKLSKLDEKVAAPMRDLSRQIDTVNNAHKSVEGGTKEQRCVAALGNLTNAVNPGGLGTPTLPGDFDVNRAAYHQDDVISELEGDLAQMKKAHETELARLAKLGHKIEKREKALKSFWRNFPDKFVYGLVMLPTGIALVTASGVLTVATAQDYNFDFEAFWEDVKDSPQVMGEQLKLLKMDPKSYAVDGASTFADFMSQAYTEIASGDAFKKLYPEIEDSQASLPEMVHIPAPPTNLLEDAQIKKPASKEEALEEEEKFPPLPEGQFRVDDLFERERR